MTSFGGAQGWTSLPLRAGLTFLVLATLTSFVKTVNAQALGPTAALNCPFSYNDEDITDYIAVCDARDLNGTALSTCCSALRLVLRRARVDYARTTGRVLVAEDVSEACIETLRSQGDARSKFSDVWVTSGTTITNFYIQQCNVTRASLSLSNPALKTCQGVGTDGLLVPYPSRDNLSLPLGACSLASSNGRTCEACRSAIASALPSDDCLETEQVALLSALPAVTSAGRESCVFGRNKSVAGACGIDYSVTSYAGVSETCQAGPSTKCCTAITGNIALSSALYIKRVQSLLQEPDSGDVNYCAQKLADQLDAKNVSKQVQEACTISNLVRYTDVNCGNLTTFEDWSRASNNFSLLYKYCDGRGQNCSSECARQSGNNLVQLVGVKPRNLLEQCGKQFFGAWGASRIANDSKGAADALNCYFGFLNTSLELTYTPAFYAAIAQVGSKDDSGSNAGAIIGGTVGGALGLLLVLAVAGLIVWRKRQEKKRAKTYSRSFQTGSQSSNGFFWFSYAELRAATKDFAPENVVGQGGSGKVYKGMLDDGSLIAVKELQDGVSVRGEEEFMNESSIISNIRHKNLVALRGCCKDGPHRMLVYDYMANASLDFHLFLKKRQGEEMRQPLDWPTRLKIAIGAAKGIHYLHEEASTKILHRDIKASNILLDDNFNPRVSDFGLAKLTEDWQTHVSTGVAGTWGYLAPEYAASGQLTERSDVYSFGVVLLELCSGRRPVQQDSHEDQIFLVEHAWALGEAGKLLDLLDPTITSAAQEYPEEVLRVAKTALLCVYTSVRVRPSMRQCVGMLTGEREVPPLPPRPQTLFSLAYDSTEFSGTASGSFLDSSKPSTSRSGSSLQPLLEVKVESRESSDSLAQSSQSERYATPPLGDAGAPKGSMSERLSNGKDADDRV